MKVNFIKKFQEGGQVEQGQPQGGGAEEQIAQVAQQLLSQIGPEGCMMLIQILGQMLQEGAAQQGGAEQPQGPPVYKRGGKVGEKRLTFIGRK